MDERYERFIFVLLCNNYRILKKKLTLEPWSTITSQAPSKDNKDIIETFAVFFL